MKRTFKKSESNFGCYDKEQVKAAKLKATFTIQDVVNKNVSLKDKAWFIKNNCEFTTKEYREFAIGCALCVLPIYEEKHPTNKAPREAIEAAQKYLAGTITLDELRAKRNAACAAGVAYAAGAAYAAAYAADAVAYAAAAAAYAAAAYAAAGADANYQIILLNFFKEFVK